MASYDTDIRRFIDSAFQRHSLPRPRVQIETTSVTFYGDSAYASQQELIRSKAPEAADLTNQRVRPCSPTADLERMLNRAKSRVRSRVEHVFAVVKRLGGFGKVRYRGLAKNGTRTFVALALANIYLARKRLGG